MNIFSRAIPIISFLIFLLGGFLLISFPSYVIAISMSVVGSLLLLLMRMFMWIRLPLLDRISFVVSSLLFFASGVSIFIFLEQKFFLYILLFGVGIIALLYLENAYKYITQSSNYQVSSLSNVSSYMHLLSVFFATVTLFNLRFIFGVPPLTIYIIAFVFGLLLFYVFLWSQKVLLISSRWYSVLFAFLFTEIIYALNILPLRPLVKGIVTLALVYGMMQIVLLSIRDALQPKKVVRTAGIVVFVLALVLATAQWI